MPKKLLEIAADIIQAQASVGQMSPEDISVALSRTFVTLQRMQKCEEEGALLEMTGVTDQPASEEQAPEAFNAQDSIQNDKIICLECGMEFRQLTAKHLISHGLTPREYKQKYGFALKTPLSARSLTKARSRAAKKRGLPPSLVRYQEERRQKKEEEMPLEEGVTDLLPEILPYEMAEEPKKPAKRGRKKKEE